MFNISQFKEGLVAAIAAVILTATAVGAAVGPAETGAVVAQLQPGGSAHV
jgi:hypothetical protein